MYLPLALDVYNRLFIDRLGFMEVDEIKKSMSGFTQSKYSPWQTVLIPSSGFGEN